MSDDLRLYDVTVGSHKTQMHLNERDAEAMGDAAVLAGSAKAPVSKVEPAEPKSRLVTHNKMRGTEPGTHHKQQGDH
jgi:hypothetical protein